MARHFRFRTSSHFDTAKREFFSICTIVFQDVVKRLITSHDMGCLLYQFRQIFRLAGTTVFKTTGL